MIGRAHRTHCLTRRSFTLLAHHGQELESLIGKLATIFFPVALDAHPVHGLPVQEFFPTHYRQIVFCITGHTARVATGTGIQIDRHRPFIWIVRLVINGMKMAY